MQYCLDRLSEISRERKAFAKYAIINMQYTDANTNDYFLLQNNPNESL